MINEVEIQRYDNLFGTKSKVFGNIIIVDSGNEEWCIEVVSNNYMGIRLLHKNRRVNKKRFHFQANKNSIYHCFDAIYTHKKVLMCVNKKRSLKALEN